MEESTLDLIININLEAFNKSTVPPDKLLSAILVGQLEEFLEYIEAKEPEEELEEAADVFIYAVLIRNPKLVDDDHLDEITPITEEDLVQDIYEQLGNISIQGIVLKYLQCLKRYFRQPDEAEYYLKQMERYSLLFLSICVDHLSFDDIIEAARKKIIRRKDTLLNKGID